MRLFSFLLVVFLSACSSQPTGKNSDSAIDRIAKSDIDEVIEVHQQAVLDDLKALMIKLYKRNPNLRHDLHERSIEESVELTLSRPYNTVYEQGKNVSEPNDIVRLAFDERFAGDRVRALILGLRKMLMASYDYRTEFYYLTSVDEQKLYNSARNLEIAAWLLASRSDVNGKPLIFSDSLQSEQRNLSFQRLFGKMIATQDNLAQIISQKTGRILKTVVVRTASMMFLPI
jgi:hypothetical protein